jgi:alanine racemase
MDMLMVDVTEIDCTEGDRNYFFENQVLSTKKNNIIPMRFWRASQRVKRFYR